MKPTTLYWKPMDTAPLDKTEILLKTNIGIVSAWADIEGPTNTPIMQAEGSYEWVCYDDMFQLEIGDPTIEAWCEIPKEAK